MVDNLGYTTRTHDIPIEVFYGMITKDIKDLIHKYGHKNCGLVYEDVCEKIKKIIVQKKPQILRHMDQPGKEKFNSEWNSKRNGFFNQLFEKEGFINMCFPQKPKGNQDLQKLKSRHIQFCKDKDVRRAAVVDNPEYNACKQYNIWIDTQRTAFTLEYLENVKDFTSKIVHKYFSTKEHPQGHDPLGTYRKSKLDCEIYNPISKRYQPIQVTKAPTDRPNLPAAPTDRQESQGNGGISVPDEKGKTEITKPDVIQLPKGQPSPSHSLTSSLTTTKMDGSASAKEPSTSPENALTKTTVTDDSNSSNSNGEPKMDNMLVGYPISESHHIPKHISDDKYLEYKSFLYHLYYDLYGQKIFHDIRQKNNIEPKKFFQKYPNYVHGEPITPITSKSNNYMPKKNLRKQRIHPALLNKQPPVELIPRLQPFPELIHNSQLYQIGKKKKKKKIKRQLEIKELRKEASHFDSVDKYSINDMQCESKTHGKNIHSHIKIQKGAINKNICSPKRIKNYRKAIIDIYMEMLNECKNDEWELNKDDFLEICLEQLIKEQNKTYADLENTGIIKKNILFKNLNAETTFLFHKWAKCYKSIWENFKRGNTFKLLQYHWKEEEKAYLDKIKTENNIWNEKNKIPLIEIKKDIWRKWITKQATLIEQYKEEQWFKSLVEELENVSDEYKQGEIMDDIFLLNTDDLDHKKNNEKLYKRKKHIYLIKVLIQILMMIIEECIKEESSEKTEIVLDNLIEKLNKEKHENIELENIHQENMNHKEYNGMLEQNKPKNQDNFKELIEG
ncbi:SICA C-terminal inner membrane domain containing protein, putative [Plasmodium ovale]|uniref:SICA C-terminal inner membrane domain containing protein, putative n=1 Tax=Plasmodium ovale TaxID=36330 RepID=A0A1C3KHW9_PLAOA|nr:SICA C-terminal inner membrane domain containing protein, putative [Plasmodium ovale]